MNKCLQNRLLWIRHLERFPGLVKFEVGVSLASVRPKKHKV